MKAALWWRRMWPKDADGGEAGESKVALVIIEEIAVSDVKRFNKWTFDGIMIRDISLEDYIARKEKCRTVPDEVLPQRHVFHREASVY